MQMPNYKMLFYGEAKLQNAILIGSQITKCFFSADAKLQNANLQRADLQEG